MTTYDFGTCEGCNGPLDLMGSMSKYKVCMGCVKARHRAATTGHRCKCGSKKNPGPVAGGDRRGARSWIPCLRCLGTIEQLS